MHNKHYSLSLSLADTCLSRASGHHWQNSCIYICVYTYITQHVYLHALQIAHASKSARYNPLDVFILESQFTFACSRVTDCSACEVAIVGAKELAVWTRSNLGKCMVSKKGIYRSYWVQVRIWCIDSAWQIWQEIRIRRVPTSMIHNNVCMHMYICV
jgi:hypothetical protein